MKMETLRVKSPQRPSPSSQPPTSSTASGATAKRHYFKSFAPHFDRAFASRFSKHFKVGGERGPVGVQKERLDFDRDVAKIFLNPLRSHVLM